MRLSSLISAKAELTHSSAESVPIVLSTRVRLARNLRECPFPGWAKEDRRREILEQCQKSLKALPRMRTGLNLCIEDLNELEQKILVERRLISRELCSGEKGGGVIISKDQSCSIMINEEDHLRIQVMRKGFHFRRVWKTINALDSSIEAQMDFEFSSRLGYLTACPSNLGTGMRASVMMHLPGLVIANDMEKVIRAVNQLGIVVRGLFGEGSDASGSIFQISNQQTLGESEAEIIKHLSDTLNTIVDQEHNARQRLLTTDNARLWDKIGRAYGILHNSHLLSSEEGMNLLSLVRLGVDLQALPEDCRPLIDRLLIEIQPGHIQFAAQQQSKTAEKTEDRDAYRAHMLRDAFVSAPTLDYQNTHSSKLNSGKSASS